MELMKLMNYFEEGKQIWKSFVPKSGQAETVQGELLRAVEKLSARDKNNVERYLKRDSGCVFELA